MGGESSLPSPCWAGTLLSRRQREPGSINAWVTTMSVELFRRVALNMPESVEGAHMEHPDFRVRGKIFATLRPEEGWGMVKLTSEQQHQFMAAKPKVFEPVKGGWGARGATRVRLKGLDRATLVNAIAAAWRNTAPKRLVEESGM